VLLLLLTSKQSLQYLKLILRL